MPRKSSQLLGVAFLFVLLTGPTICRAQNITRDTVQEKPAEQRILEPEVNFLAEAPEIDGILDAGLEVLPAREFAVVWKNREEDPDIPACYRLAYGTGFFYVYVEAEAERLVFRDRAFQNGDGFHMLLALPKPNDESTDEFYVLACSAVDNPRMEWTRRIFWYYNVSNIFVPTSRDTKLEFQASEGKISFELYLPWKDVHPYHPWFSPGIGFNLAFVKAIGEEGRNYYKAVHPTEDIGSENRKRTYYHLRFQEPELETGQQTYMLPHRNNIPRASSLEAVAVTLAAKSCREQLVVRIKSGEGDTLGYNFIEYKCDRGLTKHEFGLDTPELPPGGYSIVWDSGVGDNRGETYLTILPEFQPEIAKERIEKLKPNLSESSFSTLLFNTDEIDEQLAEVKPYETAGRTRLRLSRLNEILEQAESGKDVYAARTGFLRKAYRSKLDDTLQPYCVRIPEDYDPAQRYPLIVFLHGSASDETDLYSFDGLNPGGFIELGPKGRGPSNAFCIDNAQEDIAEAINAVVESYSVDKDNIFISGFSMGGYGALRTFYETPEKFKGVIVLSGGPDTGNRFAGGGSHPNFLKDEFLVPFKGIPVFIFHGKQDRNVPYPEAELMVEKLKGAGAEVEFHVEEDKGHTQPGLDTYNKLHAWLRRQLEK